jgi:hypothetical protein
MFSRIAAHMARAGMARLGQMAYVLLSQCFVAIVKLWLYETKLLHLINHTLMVMTAISPALFTHVLLPLVTRLSLGTTNLTATLTRAILMWMWHYTLFTPI